MATRITATLMRAQTQSRFLYDALLVVGASIVIALCARIEIPLPFTPVPMALQPQMVLLMALLLGFKRAPFAVILFVLEGLVGIPVFAGGKAGMAILFGPTGGYLLGYILAAALAAYVFEHTKTKNTLTLTATLLLGSAVLYVPGLLWLGFFVGYSKVVALGLAPFVIGDLVKVVAMAGLYGSVRSVFTNFHKGS